MDGLLSAPHTEMNPNAIHNCCTAANVRARSLTVWARRREGTTEGNDEEGAAHSEDLGLARHDHHPFFLPLAAVERAEM